MKRKLLLIAIIFTMLLSLFIVSSKTIVYASNSYVISTNGCQAGTLPTYIDLNRCSEKEIRAYYSDLNNLGQNKRSGTQVLAYLKDILYEMNYYKYDDVDEIYTITDRDWEHSPTVNTGTYDEATNTITSFNVKTEASTNPYVIMLYVDYTLEETTTLKKENGNVNFDKEHVWCQSRGFKASNGAKGPAGTDLHHLIAGDSYVNQTVHNNNPYGFVSQQSGKGNRIATQRNLKGTPKNTSTNDESTTVFEPMDEWKGDIARSIFYMMARYNNISGKDTISAYEPNLSIVAYTTGNGSAITSSETEVATIGNLSDLLAWNKLDPVSDYEIYRNDLIYRNYQGNRNPFIDFPEWIDAIWGTASEDGTNYSSEPVGYIDPSKDSLNGVDEANLKVSSSNVTINLNETYKLSASSSLESNITWTILDDSVISISTNSTSSFEEVTITGLKVGKTTINVKITDGEEEYRKNITVTVIEPESPPEIDYTRIIIVTILVIIIIIIVAIIYKNSSKKDRKKIRKIIKKSMRR